MAVDTISNFVSAVVAATGKSGKAVYTVGPQNANGDLPISVNGAAFMTVTYSTNPDWSAATDANPKATGVLVRAGQTGIDSSKYYDAQAFINMLNGVN
jgi:hypothetical protein